MMDYIRLILGLFFLFDGFLLIYVKKKDLIPNLKYKSFFIIFNFFIAFGYLYIAFT
ncbi:putative membrane protein [Methanobacterium sp. MB1]|jgi:hypothetical protein|nr:putative membrane protein [Methanobacterium sp. MB1]